MVVTGSRAEYGILKSVLTAINKHPKLDLLLMVTGMHLSYEFGYTVKDIEKDGFDINFKIDMLLSSDTKSSMAKSLAIGILGMTEAIKIAKPDIVLVCGDRSEPFAATIASSYLSVPLVHLFGGDAAIGSNIDDSIRHAITKFAHIHLVATAEHKNRIIKLGEESWRVHIVGSPMLDSILYLKKKIPRKEFAKRFGLDLNSPIILVLQHPTTVESKNASRDIKETLDAIIELKYQTILIYPNADASGRKMIDIIKKYEKYSFIKTFKSLPQEDFLGLMKIANVMVGNSSSGILEAPSFHLPVINIGPRQIGRERSENVIDVGYNKTQILNAIKKTFKDVKFIESLKKCKNPYGDGKASERIVKILSEVKIDKNLLEKKITY